MNSAYFSPLANHLWQSTVFAAFAGLLALAFRHNRAPVRYGLWLAASLKFLIPFSLLVSIGGHLEWTAPRAVTQPEFSFVMDEISQPFTSPASAPMRAGSPVAPSRVAVLLLCVWLSGFAAVVFFWLRQWLRIRAAALAASPLDLNLPIEARSSPARLEPGVLGIFRPVLLLPEGITDRLTPAQLQTILAHELCHVRRRDNLTAALHMLVEAVFWFHPLVWWIGSRLVAERERACDEEVLRMAGEPAVYAEGILNVCKFYLESPLVCASGVTGASLKKRIEEIMSDRIAHNLNLGKKVLLASAGSIAVAAPILMGILSSPQVRAQTQPAPALAFEVASVKPNKSPDFRGGLQFLPGGRLKATNVPLYLIIASAYDVPFQSIRLSGGPEWTRSEKYDIEASAAPGAVPATLSTKAREAKMRLMLQALLADRFHLTVRRETKDLPAYVVVVAKSGLKLPRAKLEEKDCPDGPTPDGIRCHIINGGMGRGLHGKAVEISDIVTFVENWSDRPMIDKTGLHGLFEVESDGWAPMRPRPVAPGTELTAEQIAMADPARPTLFMIFDRLGLKMEPQRAPVDTFVIDNVERPSDN